MANCDVVFGFRCDSAFEVGDLADTDDGSGDRWESSRLTDETTFKLLGIELGHTQTGTVTLHPTSPHYLGHSLMQFQL